MKLPKYFYKLSLQEQESFMTELLFKNNAEHDYIMKILGTIRGGYKYKPETEERADLEYEIPKNE